MHSPALKFWVNRTDSVSEREMEIPLLKIGNEQWEIYKVIMCGKKKQMQVNFLGGLLAPEILRLFVFPILLTRSVPDEGYFSNVPDEGYFSNVPDEGYFRNVIRYLRFYSIFVFAQQISPYEKQKINVREHRRDNQK